MLRPREHARGRVRSTTYRILSVEGRRKRASLRITPPRRLARLNLITGFLRALEAQILG